MPSSQPSPPPDRSLAAVRARGAGIVRSSGKVFWRTTIAVTLLLFFAFVIVHNKDFRDLSARTLFGLLLVLGYSLFYGVCVAGGVTIFALAWRLWGAWILIPLFGALFGAAAFVAAAAAIVNGLDAWPARAGPHGGGEIAAFLLLAAAVLVAAVGAAIGGFVGFTVAVVLSVSRRRSPTPQER
jgi:hypothetical protein